MKEEIVDKKGVEYTLYRPLINYSIDDVVAMHKRHNLPLNPLYLKGASRIGCWPCINARKDEIKLISEISPEAIEKLIEWEDIISQAAKQGCATFFFARDLARKGEEFDHKKHGIEAQRSVEQDGTRRQAISAVGEGARKRRITILGETELLDGRLLRIGGNMTEEERIEWLKGRQFYIGGSDIGAIAGDSPYQTKFDIYHSKVDEITDDKANKQMRVGTDLEPVIGKWFAEEHDGWACAFNPPTEYGDEPYFGYNADGILYPAHAAALPILYECKTAKFAHDWGEAPYGDIPDAYYDQVQWGMGILGIGQAIVYVMIGGGFPIEYHIDCRLESLRESERCRPGLLESLRHSTQRARG